MPFPCLRICGAIGSLDDGTTGPVPQEAQRMVAGGAEIGKHSERSPHDA
jgi:hypothetical protein